MTALYIYDHNSGEFTRHTGAAIPFLAHGRIAVRGFLGQSAADVAWTDLRLLNAYDALCLEFGAPIYVGAGFCRTHSGLHAGQSAHYAGLALHMGQGMSFFEREKLRLLATGSGLFSYVEPSHLAPVWVHAELSVAPSCSLARGYPYLARGMRGVHVFVLQDALLRAGQSTALTGAFDDLTERALLRFRGNEGLAPDAYVDAPLWDLLLRRAREPVENG